MVVVTVKTGLRCGELFDIEWRDINFTLKQLTVRGEIAKSKRTRHMPLTNTAPNVLTKWKSQFPNTSEYQNKSSLSEKEFPLLLDIQTTPLESLQTTVVIPLKKPEPNKNQFLTQLTPTFSTEGNRVFYAYTSGGRYSMQRIG